MLGLEGREEGAVSFDSGGGGGMMCWHVDDVAVCFVIHSHL